MMRQAPFVLLTVAVLSAQKTTQPSPDSFVVARRTFIDIGPPFEYYELIAVRPLGARTVVDRALFAPDSDVCTHATSLETSIAYTTAAVSDLLGGQNPCTIPERDLRRELKRCKKCPVFSGANVTMQVQCGAGTRLIRADILDRDLFDRTPNTPERTSWTMKVLSRIDEVVGHSVMEKPIFSTGRDAGSGDAAPGATGSDLLNAIGRGAFDEIFGPGFGKPSQLLRDARAASTLPQPSVRLKSSDPFRPTSSHPPAYPPLARAARVDGDVSFILDVTPDGSVSNPKIVFGHALLRTATLDAIAAWKFPPEAAGQEIHGSVEFRTNCAPAKNQ